MSIVLAAMVVVAGCKDSNTPPLPMMMIAKVDVAVLYLLVVAARWGLIMLWGWKNCIISCLYYSTTA